MDYPYTISFCIKKSLQIDSFNELPKGKRPPKSLWDNDEELEEWFEDVMGSESTGTSIIISDDDIE